MAKDTIRYGRRIRKAVRAIKKNKISLYKCESCGHISVERVGTGIWRCRHCEKTYAGGAYTMTTPAGEFARQQIKMINEGR
jgi:Ribosomal protein L37AE/L43A